MIAITICATDKYTYAMRTQARRVAANCFGRTEPITVILVGDTSPALKSIANYYREIMPAATVKVIGLPGIKDDAENYKETAQLLIAKLRSEAFSAARAVNAEYCWSLDSDTLPPPNALRCMLDMLRFDNGYYSVSACPYPNALFLGGFGSLQHNIEEDYLPQERLLPPELKAQWEADEAELKALNEAKTPVTDEHRARWAETHKKIKECPADGNIWQVIAKHGWRRRGWLDHAYPAIGKGSVVPSDWCGFGCTLLSREALALAHFDGYDGKGTEDLYICWQRWFPAKLRINCITHCPCDHVIWDRKKKGGDAEKYTHHIAYHEPEGEHRGHLRVRQKPWLPES